MQKKLLFLFFSFLLTSTCWTQIKGLDLIRNKSKIEIPFQIDHGFIVVKVRINRTLPLKFIFDTGAEHSILFHKTYADLLGLEYSKRIRVIGSDLTEELFALITRNVIVDIPGVTSVLRDLLVLESNQLVLEETIGIRLDGILGGSFFRGLVVDIDYKKKIITLINPDEFRINNKSYHEYDLLIDQNKPYLDTETILHTGDTVITKLLLDTGAALPFLLHANTDSNLILPEHSIRGNIGQGMGGIIFGFLGKIDQLKFGDLYFNHILTSFQDIDSIFQMDKQLVRNGIIGNTLLGRFHVIIDYMRSKLYLKPEKKYNEDFAYDKSGLVIFAFGQELNEFVVKAIIPGSPAYRAGLLPGDIILKLGWRKSHRWSLEKMNKKLSGKEGKKICMIIDRNGTKMKVKFKLEDLIKVPPKMSIPKV